MTRMMHALSGSLLVAFVVASCSHSPQVLNTNGPPLSGTPFATPSTLPSTSPSPKVRVPRIPAGTYQFDVTLRDLQRLGGGTEGVAVEGNTGRYTVRVRGGRWRMVHTADHPVTFHLFEGIYTGSDHRVTFELQSTDSDFAGASATCRWSFDPSTQTLTLKLLSAEPDEFTAFAHVLFRLWRKTG
jgi:hypothetical protein